MSYDSLFDLPCCYDRTPFAHRSTEETSTSSLATADDDHSSNTGQHSTPRQKQELASSLDPVLGWTLDAGARGTLIMGGAVFVSTALLRLAKEAAGCQTDFEEDEEIVDCHGRVYGMRPSSLLTNIVTIVGLVSASSMPLIGSIIDHTRYRRHVGRISAALLTALILVQIILLENVWFGAAITQIFVAFCYAVHLCAVYAYLPELTDDPDQLVRYTGRFTASQYGSSVVFLMLMVMLLRMLSISNVVESAHVSQSVVFVVCTLFFGYAWTRLFPDRPALQEVPPGEYIFTAGFRKIFATSQTILLHHNAIKWFLVSAALTESATTAFSSIAITFMTDRLHFSSTENGIAILLVLMNGIPGTWLASFFTNRFNPIRSLQLCLMVWMISIAGASVFLHGRGRQAIAYCFATVWGLCLGWVYPTEKVLYCTIIPKGQEAELMGVYICACQILSWLPPLVFTVMNESHIAMQLGLLTLNSYFLLSFVILFLVGDYEAALRHAKEVDEGRKNHNEKVLTSDYKTMTD